MTEIFLQLLELNPFVFMAIGAGIGFVVGGMAATSPDNKLMFQIMFAIIFALGFLQFIYIPGFEKRATSIKTDALGENPAIDLLCERAKKMQEHMKLLNPYLVQVNHQLADLHDTEMQRFVNDVCQVKPAEEEEEEEGGDKKPTLKSLMDTTKGLLMTWPEMKDYQNKKKSEFRDAFIKYIETFDKKVCVPFEDNKTSFDKKADEFVGLEESCREWRRYLAATLYKQAEFDLAAQNIIKTHPLLEKGKDDTEALEYAKANKEKLATDGKELCELSGVIGEDADMIDYDLVRELLTHGDVDACKKTV